MIPIDELIPDPGLDGMPLLEEGPLGPGLELPGSGVPLNGIPLELVHALDYRGGRIRVWANGTRETATESVGVVVLEFADPRGAAALIDAEAALIAVVPEVSRFVPFDGAGLSGCLISGDASYSATSIFAIDRYAVIVATECETADRAVEMAQAATPAQVVAAERHLAHSGRLA